MKSKTEKTSSAKVRHQPVGTKGNRKFDQNDRRNKSKSSKNQNEYDEDELIDDDDNAIPSKISSSLLHDIRNEEIDHSDDDENLSAVDNSDEEDDDDAEVDGTMVYDADGKNISDSADVDFRMAVNENEEEVIKRFLYADKIESRSLADLILEKLKEKETMTEVVELTPNNDEEKPTISIPPKVVEVYTAVGNMLSHYRSGKLPKALKMLPHLKNWEQILWITRPDRWSPMATFVVTRIFVSNLKVKMAQRFFNIVLLEKCRDDIYRNDKLNYHLYMALKKALFKPAAFYKGILLPLALSGNCTLREATIIGSAITKVSIPSIHSAAALLRLAEMPYSGSTSVFIKLLLVKKYALPQRVIDALVSHFQGFTDESRTLPIIWHQSLLIFVQRYKLDFSQEHILAITNLLKTQIHYEISPEIKRELSMNRSAHVMQI